MSDRKDYMQVAQTNPAPILKEAITPIDMPEPDRDILETVTEVTDPTPTADTSTPTPPAMPNVPVEVAPPPLTPGTDQPNSPTPVPRRSTRIRKPRQLISMNMKGQYHD